MLDEPASGLSRGERQLLADLLLALDRSITLLLIEHDMDVALRVAERVTMMHDGRVIVEGTPAEIRANQLVHDLYLGSSHHTEAKAASMAEPGAFLQIEGLDAFYGSAHILHGVGFGRRRVGCGRRAQRHGEDDALRLDHGPHALVSRVGPGLDPVPRHRARRTAAAQDRGPRHRLRAAGRRLFPSLSVDEHLRMLGRSRDGAWTTDAGLRPLPAARRAEAEQRRAALGGRAADARDRPRAAHEPEALDHGRALGRAGAGDHRDDDRRLPAPRAGGAAHPADRAEPRRRDLARALDS